MDSSRFCLRNLLAALLPIHRRSGHGRATRLDSRSVQRSGLLRRSSHGGRPRRPTCLVSRRPRRHLWGNLRIREPCRQRPPRSRRSDGGPGPPDSPGWPGIRRLLLRRDEAGCGACAREHPHACGRLPFFPRRQSRESRARLRTPPRRSELGACSSEAFETRGCGGDAKSHHLQFESWVSKASRSLEPADTSKDDVAFWLYSSGSTGFPKGAVHLHHDMVVCSDTYGLQVLGITERDRTFSAAKLFFAYGLGNNMYFPMRVGAEAVLYSGRPTAEAVFQVLERYRPTLFFGVPTLYASMLQMQDAEDRFDLSSLRLCVSAGEALPADLYQRWVKRFGVELLDGIGTTEILHIFLSNRPGRVKPGSSGSPVPGYEAIIVDEAGNPVRRGEIGSLRVKGDSTMAYYWNRHEKTKETLFGPWIQTGDKYYQDEDGDFWYCGRSDDMLKVGGIWVSPVEVEATLVAHEAVLEAAVVGQQDAEKLVKPKAYVVLKDPKDASQELAEELKEFVRNRIAPYKKPWWIDFVPSLPKTATGKIQRYRLRQGGAR